MASPAAEPAAAEPTAAGPARAARRRRRPALLLVYVLYIWGLAEAGSWVGLWALARKGIEYRPGAVPTLIRKHRAALEAHLDGRAAYVVLDPELGWTVGRSRQRGKVRSNAAGLRGDREYAPQPPAGVVRLAAFGDSFTHSSGVANPMTWEAQLERLAPGVEALNFGIPGSAPDQALLRYRREGAAFHPHVVLIGFMSENVHRMVNTFRPFYFPNSGMALAKPRFLLSGNGLELAPNPLPSLDAYRELLADPEGVLPRVGRHDYYYRRQATASRLDLLPSVRLAWVVRQRFSGEPIVRGGIYNPRSEAFEVSLRVVDAFHREALETGSLPVVLLFPQYDDLVRHRDGEAVLYAPLLHAFRERGLITVDLLAAFERHDPEGALLRRRFIHYPRAGNELVARHLLDWLRAERLEDAGAVRARVRAERQRHGIGR